MSNITLTNTLTDGQVADADEVMANFNDIVNVVNGSIDGTNISSSSALAITSLAATGAISLAGVLTSTLATGTAPLAVTSTTVCTNLNADTVDGYEASELGASDGWFAVADTWTYASSTTITVPTGAASIYSVGMKIKITQTTAKYFYISAVADTTLTVNGAGLYTVADAAISSPYFSPAATPLNFPMDMIPGYVKARAYAAADQDNVAATTWTKVTLGSESYDTSGDFASSGFTAPVTGYYHITGTVVIEGTDITSSNDHACAIYVDPLGTGSPALAQVGGYMFAANTTINLPLIVETELYLTKSDIVYLYVYTAEADNDIESGATNTSLSVSLVSIL